jgi:putative peptide zinc metalloprotease protein
MTTTRRLTLALVAALAALLLGLAHPGGALGGERDDDGGGDNSAVAINTRDGATLFKLAFDIRRVAGDVVDETNVAIAYSSCDRCQTTAIAIQIVLVTGDASTVTPQNVAVAVNENCTLCETFATAYQFVVSTGGEVRFTRDGRRAIADIRKRLKDLRKEDLTPAELDARVDALMDELQVVLENELVPVRGRDRDDEDEDDEDFEEQEDLAPEDEPTTSTEPVETETTETVTTEPTTTGTTETTETGATTTAP